MTLVCSRTIKFVELLGYERQRKTFIQFFDCTVWSIRHPRSGDTQVNLGDALNVLGRTFTLVGVGSSNLSLPEQVQRNVQCRNSPQPPIHTFAVAIETMNLEMMKCLTEICINPVESWISISQYKPAAPKLRRIKTLAFAAPLIASLTISRSRETRNLQRYLPVVTDKAEINVSVQVGEKKFDPQYFLDNFSGLTLVFSFSLWHIRTVPRGCGRP